jgi:hypothetical protein
MTEFEMPGIIAETTVRLFAELSSKPEFQQKIEKRNADARVKREGEVLSENPGVDPVTMRIATLFRELNQEHLVHRVFVRTQHRMLEILLASLSEKSQREAVQQMRALAAEDVLKDIA